MSDLRMRAHEWLEPKDLANYVEVMADKMEALAEENEKLKEENEKLKDRLINMEV